MLAALLLLLSASTARADELGFRLSSAISANDNNIVGFPTGGLGSPAEYQGKLQHFFYDHDLTQNFFIEAAVGDRSYSDIFQYSSVDYELSPGFRIQAGPVVLRLSEGVSYMPENSFNSQTYQGYQQVDFVTHLTLGLVDNKTGWGIYFDRSHYSNGNSVDNPSLNYQGFVISKRF
jgi:hypothetical protein